jgi:hypothetical protein
MVSTKTRPIGIVIIAVLWTLGSIYNIYQGINGIIIDLGVLPNLSNPSAPEWFRFGIPVEIIIAFFFVVFGFLTLLVVYGLIMGRSWSYDFALLVPIIVTVLNFWQTVLYYSAPLEIGLRETAEGAIPIIVFNIFWLVVIWSYLTRPHVKHYLKETPLPSPLAPILPPPPPPSLIASSEKKFCRYCGTENKTDAVFCEKCGKRIA